MLIRPLCAHEMTKHVCKISRLNSKRLLRKLQKLLGGYFILPHPVYTYIYMAYTNVDRLCSFYIIPYTARMASNTAYCTTVHTRDIRLGSIQVEYLKTVSFWDKVTKEQ